MNELLKTVRIDDYSITPKYLQLINSIMHGIQSGKIIKNDPLPSINEFSCALDTARSTIERAYNELKRIGLVTSVAGKGFFILSTCFERPVKILLLFNKLSIHKKMIYDAFAETLGDEAAIDFYIYNNSYRQFERLIEAKAEHYDKCVIIPHFTEKEALGYDLIDALPKDKLILMDKLAEGIEGKFGAVYEDFESDIFNALTQLKERLERYSVLKIIFPKNAYYSKSILTGFVKFCKQYGFQHQILDCLEEEKVEKHAAYINLVEDDLVILIEKAMQDKLVIGQDVGIVSYNETPIKKIILDGITTISSDFKMMGEKTAELILNNSVAHIPIPFKVTLRNSL